MPYTAGLLGSIPGLAGSGTSSGRSNRLRPIPGAPPSLINLPPGCPFSPRCPMVKADCLTVEPALVATEQHGHRAACHYWAELADLPEPTTIFRAQEVAAE
jgi:peptide/nickel transport system ATP-binding protein